MSYKENSNIEIVYAVLNFNILNKSTLEKLKLASLKSFWERFIENNDYLNKNLFEISVVEKCNAVGILAVYDGKLTSASIENEILVLWSGFSCCGVDDLRSDIFFFHNYEAIRYLGQSVVGIHSVQVGDSQSVLSGNWGFKKKINLKKQSKNFQNYKIVTQKYFERH